MGTLTNFQSLTLHEVEDALRPHFQRLHAEGKLDDSFECAVDIAHETGTSEIGNIRDFARDYLDGVWR